MYRKLLLTAAIVASFAAPAFAATYWVGQDAKTHKCAVETTKPDGTKIIMIGTASYASKADAEAALKADAACK